ncbi:MCE family protein [Haloechinothrix sp. YIM 98757]|uniref:MCE family protein n=2 Tax=Haloechinothrix aidingensis TaxID=2752311 RepID=A0A838AC16_9PSEU|nr:MCE family protein [Haloechinothrix aidingensis]
MAERVRTVPGLLRNVVVLTVFFAVGLISTGYLFANYGVNVPWSDDSFEFAAEFEHAPGVNPSSPQEVRIAGVPVGEIESAEPQDGDKARLVMSIESDHTVYTNARLILRSKSPLNVMYVALDPGGPPGDPLPENGTIPVSQTERPIHLYETLKKLDERARDATTSLINQADAALVSAPEQLPDGLRAADETMASFRPVLEELQTRRETISNLVTSLARVSAAVGEDDERLARLVASLQESLGVLANRDKELDATLAELPGLTQDVRHAMTSASALTEQLDPTLSALHGVSDELPDTLRGLTETVGSAGTVVDEAAPVVDKAKPVVADLKPLARDVNATLGDLAPVTGHLPDATERIVPWLDHLAAFVYQTSSAFSIHDDNGGFGRANFTLDVTNPSGGLDTHEEQGTQGGGE